MGKNLLFPFPFYFTFFFLLFMLSLSCFNRNVNYYFLDKQLYFGMTVLK